MVAILTIKLIVTGMNFTITIYSPILSKFIAKYFSRIELCNYVFMRIYIIYSTCLLFYRNFAYFAFT